MLLTLNPEFVAGITGLGFAAGLVVGLIIAEYMNKAANDYRDNHVCSHTEIDPELGLPVNVVTWTPKVGEIYRQDRAQVGNLVEGFSQYVYIKILRINEHGVEVKAFENIRQLDNPLLVSCFIVKKNIESIMQFAVKVEP